MMYEVHFLRHVMRERPPMGSQREFRTIDSTLISPAEGSEIERSPECSESSPAATTRAEAERKHHINNISHRRLDLSPSRLTMDGKIARLCEKCRDTSVPATKWVFSSLHFLFFSTLFFPRLSLFFFYYILPRRGCRALIKVQLLKSTKELEAEAQNLRQKKQRRSN